MGEIASQITILTIVYSTVYSDADQRKHQSSASLAFVRGIHRGLVNSPHKWPVTRKMFPFDDVIMNADNTTVSNITLVSSQNRMEQIYMHMDIYPYPHRRFLYTDLMWQMNSQTHFHVFQFLYWNQLNKTENVHWTENWDISCYLRIFHAFNHPNIEYTLHITGLKMKWSAL